MAKKKFIPPTDRLKYQVIRQYRANFNSSARTAEVFGVSQRTMQRWLREVVQDKVPIHSVARAERYMEKASRTVPFLVEGGEEARVISERKTKNFVFQSFDLTRGKTLPENVYTRNIDAYQLVMQDQYGKTITTTVGTMPAVLSEARKKMAKYPKFHASKVILQIRTDIRDVA